MIRNSLRYYRHSDPVIYKSKLPAPSVLMFCESRILQSPYIHSSQMPIVSTRTYRNEYIVLVVVSTRTYCSEYTQLNL